VADFQLIETREELDSLAQELLAEKLLAFDTEADSFYHYFDKTCLVQVATPRQIYLIDPLALGGPKELSPLAPVFASPEIRKVFHAAEYDLFVLKRDCGFEFRRGAPVQQTRCVRHEQASGFELSRHVGEFPLNEFEA